MVSLKKEAIFVNFLQYLLNSKCTKDDMKFCLKIIECPNIKRIWYITWFDFKKIVESNTPIDLQCTDVRGEDIAYGLTQI